MAVVLARQVLICLARLLLVLTRHLVVMALRLLSVVLRCCVLVVAQAVDKGQHREHHLFLTRPILVLVDEPRFRP